MFVLLPLVTVRFFITMIFSLHVLFDDDEHIMLGVLKCNVMLLFSCLNWPIFVFCEASFLLSPVWRIDPPVRRERETVELDTPFSPNTHPNDPTGGTHNDISYSQLSICLCLVRSFGWVLGENVPSLNVTTSETRSRRIFNLRNRISPLKKQQPA